MSQERNILMLPKGSPQPQSLYFDNACFDTGKYITPSLTKIEAKFRVKLVNIPCWFFGTRNLNATGDRFTLQITGGSNSINNYIEESTFQNSVLTLHQTIEYSYDGSDIYINGALWDSPNMGFPTCGNTLFVGALNNNGSITTSGASFNGEFYYLRGYDGNGIIFEFIPWYENGVYYVKETISNTLISPYYGTFYGSDPTTHTLLTSCYFNNAVVDTGVIIKNTFTRFDIKYSYTRTSAGYWEWGCRTTNSTDRFTGQDATNGAQIIIGNTTNTINVTDKSKAMDCTYDGTIFKITNEGSDFIDTFSGFPSGVYPFSIGRLNNGGSFTSSGMQGLFWHCRFYDTGTLIAEFLPVKDSNNTVCLYNTVSGYYHLPNNGTITETP